MSTINDTDLLLVNRGGVDYKITAQDLLDANGGGGSFSGDYNDLSNKPTIGNGKITLVQGGIPKGTFTVNQTGNTQIELDAGGGGGGGGSICSCEHDAMIHGLTVGRGGAGIHSNTAFGIDALGVNDKNNVGADLNFAGKNNTAVGYHTLWNNYQEYFQRSTGNANTALGSNALINNTTGSGNIAIGGMDADGNYAPVADITTGNNTISMGSTSVTGALIKVAWTVTSDARDKTNFAPVPYGLDFVKQLQPTAYQFKAGSRNARNPETNELIPVTAADELPSGPVRYGFKAQDILALEGDNPVIIDNEDPDHLRYRGESLVPVLVNAIKEQQVLIDALTARLARLENEK